MISENTKFYSSGSLIDSYISSVTIKDSTMFNLVAKTNLILLTSSTGEIEN